MFFCCFLCIRYSLTMKRFMFTTVHFAGGRKKSRLSGSGILVVRFFSCIYASAKELTGSQVQIRFRSPCVLFTRATLGQNLFCVT